MHPSWAALVPPCTAADAQLTRMRVAVLVTSCARRGAKARAEERGGRAASADEVGLGE